MKMKHDLPHIDCCFDIDEATSDTPPRRQILRSKAEHRRLLLG
jgi:hypothetical protein